MERITKQLKIQRKKEETIDYINVLNVQNLLTRFEEIYAMLLTDKPIAAQ